MKQPQAALIATIATGLSGCGIYHAQPYQPQASTISTAEGADAATNCFESTTRAERLACADLALGAKARSVASAFQQDLRAARLFGRDMLLASQEVWLTGLAAQCHLGTAPDAQASACLAAAATDRIAILAAWRPPASPRQAGDAVAQYVAFRTERSFAAAPPGFCATLAAAAGTALRLTGTADPATMPGAAERAGSHGPPEATLPDGRRVAVAQHDANVFGLYERRARALSLGGVTALDATSLATLAQSQAENSGGRFSNTASQTGDYGQLDVLTLSGRNIALLADPWGFDAPASPGEFARAGVWSLDTPAPEPLCLFATYKVPAADAFASLPSFAPWRDQLHALVPTSPELGVAALRDRSQLRAAAEFEVLDQPLLAIQDAKAAGWNPWLRRRHDQALDALFAWSAREPANKPAFDRLFALLRPAAEDLVRTYQQTQALGPDEARQAAGLAVMELVYGAASAVDPTLGSALSGPDDAAGYRPRYPILASPS